MFTHLLLHPLTSESCLFFSPSQAAGCHLLKCANALFMFVRLLPWQNHVCLILKSFNSDLPQIESPGFRMFSDFKVLDNAGSICRTGDLSHVISIFHFVAEEECICYQIKLKSNDNQPHHQMELLFCLSCWRCWSCGTELTGTVGI